jgi:peroxiredoxin
VLNIIPLLVVGTHGAQSQEYIGALRDRLVLPNALLRLVLSEITLKRAPRLPTEIPPHTKLYIGKIELGGPNNAVTVILCDLPNGSQWLMADENLDGEIAPPEIFQFKPATRGTLELQEVELHLALRSKLYKTYPFRIGLPKGPMDWLKTPVGEKAVLISDQPRAEGTVDVDGRPMLVRYAYSIEKDSITPSFGYNGMDCNGDGLIDANSSSPEVAQAFNESIVFRVGTRFVSTKTIDLRSREIRLRRHPASDYERIELRLGAVVPAFTFQDLTGAGRSFADFRGKHVLLDFWGTWCGPCVAEIPNMKSAYAKYRDRGFEILGMLQDDMGSKGLKGVQEFLTVHGVTWTQANTDSIKSLLEKRFRISSYPTVILVDPEGKIISVDQGELPLRGPGLMSTLEKLLPSKESTPSALTRG